MAGKWITSVQLVTKVEGKPTHVKRLYFDLDGTEVQEKIEKALKGHLVPRKNGENSPQIGEEKSVQTRSRGEEEVLDLDEELDQVEEEETPRKKKKR